MTKGGLLEQEELGITNHRGQVGEAALLRNGSSSLSNMITRHAGMAHDLGYYTGAPKKAHVQTPGGCPPIFFETHLLDGLPIQGVADAGARQRRLRVRA